jgi:hypothetical protein
MINDAGERREFLFQELLRRRRRASIAFLVMASILLVSKLLPGSMPISFIRAMIR